MQNWLLHWPATHHAVAWPYPADWRTVVTTPTTLAEAAAEFGLISMCDGADEIPNVPARLPRGCPLGDYRAGFYHDDEAVYLLFAGRDAPGVVSREEAERRTGPLADPPVMVQVILAGPDAILAHRYTRAPEGPVSSAAFTGTYGPRKPANLPPPPPFEFAEAQIAGEYRCGWRLPRPSLAPLFDGSRLLAGVAWMSLTSLELAVWGSAGGWGIRRDELVEVRFVDRRPVSIWPDCRRIELDYDPDTEQSRFRLAWRDLFRPDEAIDNSKQSHRLLRSHHLEVRVNGLARMYPFADSVDTDPFPLADGHNELHVSCAGGSAVRLFLEKRSGNRMAPCPFPDFPLPLPADFRARCQAELDAEAADMRARQAGEAELDFIRWPASRAASCGRYHHYVESSPLALDVLRDVADRTLALQREDGTFSGYHLGRHQASQEARRWSGGAYDSGQAGELWTVAAWLLGDAKYLDASRRLVRAYDQYRVEFNQNFAAFALYHLVTHYRLTRETEALDKALFTCRHLVATKLLPLGYQGGHNYYTVYGFITLRGMALLCQILPDSHPYRHTLRELCLRMANQYLTRLQPDGTADTRDRYFVGERIWTPGLCSVAFLLDGDDLRRLDATIRHTLRAPAGTPRCRWLDSDLVRYLAHRDRLLAGEPIDLLAMV